MDNRCIIIEDDGLALSMLKSLLSSVGYKGEILGFLSVKQTLSSITIQPTDLLFLDVGLPEINGLDFVRTLSVTPMVIIITSDKKFAYDAFELNALDYILKPVTKLKLLNSLNKVKLIQNPLLFSNKNTNRIYLRHNGQHVAVEINKILYVEAMGDYVKIHTPDKRYAIKRTLTFVENELEGKHFLRIHRSYLINLDQVNKIDEGGVIIEKTLIPISRKKRSVLLQHFNIID